MWHNEEMLAPLFLQHYGRASKLTILLDDCTDRTEHIIKGHAEVHKITSGGLDDIQKAQLLSITANNSDADMRIVVDADEFVYSTSHPREHPFCAIASVIFHEVFRHETDVDIDPHSPPLQQRTHGNPIAGQSFGQNSFTKPIVFPRGIDVDLAPGNHSLNNRWPIVAGHFEGAHWAMADPELAKGRRLEKSRRMSMVNYQNGLTSHDWHITGSDITDECAAHTQDPQVIITAKGRF